MRTSGESLILVVDDKPAVRYVTERTIRHAGFRTAEAATGEEALEKAQSLKPDVMVLDIAMPGIDGYEVCRRIRENEVTASMAIVMMSATFESAEHRVRGLDVGADSFIVAPVEPAVLVATVKAMVRLRRAEAELREFDRLKNEFLATLAHELRNPLAPLLYCIDLIDTPDGQADLDNTLAIMRRQGQHLVRLVDDLVDMSRITQNKLTLKVEPLVLQEVIGTAVEARRPEVRARQQTLTVDLPDEPISMRGDEVRLAQVFGNLIGNSIKYTGDGGHIHIAVKVEGPFASVEISDDGIGIMPEDLERVFGLFVQGRHLGGGLGIGLALVHRMVRMHNGTITASSEGLHCGSTFTVRLPVLHADDLAVRGAADGAAGPIAPLKIVVVDDNIDLVDAMANLLRAMGHHVRTCYDGEAGLRVAREFEPDLAFVDITMPGMNGYDTVAAMRTQAWSAHAMICTLSGHSQVTDQQRSEAAGADLHLVKPLRRADLERVLRAAHELARDPQVDSAASN